MKNKIFSSSKTIHSKYAKVKWLYFEGEYDFLIKRRFRR